MARHDSRRVSNVIRSAVGTTPKRILAVLVGVLVLVAIATPVAFARQDTLAVTTQSLVVEAPQEVDGVPTYGANQSVTITGGVHYIPSGCLNNKNDPGPVVISNSDILLELNGVVVSKTSVSAFGNLLLGVPLGITGPTGTLGSGLYSVVYDECQDGAFTAGQDARFDAAFRVIVPTDAPIIDLGATKENAQKVADTIGSLQSGITQYNKLRDTTSALAGDPAVAQRIKETDTLIATFGSPSLKSAAATVKNPGNLPALPKNVVPILQQLQQYQQLIANDPPDPAYAQLTTVTPGNLEAFAGPDGAVASSAAATAGLTQGLLHAVERYQGAAAAKNGLWATVHAREIAQLARASASQMQGLRSVLGAFAAATAALPPIDPDLVAALTAAKAGLTPAQQQSLRNGGLSPSEITAFQTALAVTDPTIDAAAVRSRVDAVTAALDPAAAALTALADTAATTAASLGQNPATGPTPATVSAGGPYTVGTGATVALTATATGGTEATSLTWDLNGDGVFDDATGPTPAFVAGSPGTYLVAVQALDAAGQRPIAPAVVTVTGTGTPASATPTPSVRLLDVGATQDFAVATGQPVQWFVDNAAAATGATFSYNPKRLADTGVHLVTALVGATGTARSTLRWVVVVQAPDADADGWHANVDCNDAVGAIHPGQPEVPGNGTDDDCDPLTVDGGGTPTGISLAYPDFGSVNGLVLNGAEQIGTALRLAVTAGGLPRSVWATQPVNPAASFSSTFDVSIHDTNFVPADGVVFALQSTTGGIAAVGGGGGDIGIGGVTPSVAVEFDTYTNPWDPNANHIAVDVNGDVGAPVAVADSPLALFGTPFTARVAYDAPTTTLTVFIGPQGSVPATPLITTKVDIAATLGTASPAYAGFTGSTGAATENADLLSWRFDGAHGANPAALRPIAGGLDLATTAGSPVSGTLTASGAAPTYAVTEQPLHGTATVDGNRLSYTPEAGFVGSDSLAYTATADGATSAPAVVTIQVGPAAAAPTIAAIEPVTAQKTAVTREVSATAPGATTLTLTAADLPAGSTFQDLGAGRGLLTVDPAGAAAGTTTATITAASEGGSSTTPVRITIAGNRAPTAQALHATTPFQQAVTLTATATDPDGDSLTYAIQTPPAHGTVTANGTAFTYTPAAGYSGADGFVFAVSDGTATTGAAAVIDIGAAPPSPTTTPTPTPTTTPAPTTTPTPTPNPSPPCTPVNRPGPKADLSITLKAPDTLRAATTGSVTVTVCNSGPAAARKIAVAITLPRGCTISRTSRGTPDRSRLGLADVIPTLAPGASLQYTVTVSADRAIRGRLTLTASVGSLTPDPVLGNNLIRKTITVTA